MEKFTPWIIKSCPTFDNLCHSDEDNTSCSASSTTSGETTLENHPKCYQTEGKARWICIPYDAEMSFNLPLVAKLWLIYVNLHIDYLSKVLHQDTRILYHYRTSSCWIVLNYPIKLNHLTNFKYKLRLKLNVKYGFFLRLPSRCTNCTFWNECNTIQYITYCSWRDSKKRMVADILTLFSWRSGKSKNVLPRWPMLHFYMMHFN